jgi:hypothetical protein
MGLRNETGTHRGPRMRKRIEPVGIPRIHAAEDVKGYFCTDFGCCVAVRASGFFGDQSSGGKAMRQN